ncbi:MAG: TIM44-like domain-containing protein [Thermoleophilaceae bacterium]|nr:TIM44-like domain-containing protein [Thermoleophilaceae bacterium]
MDATTMRLLLRLSIAVSTLVCLVVATLFGIELPFGRAGRSLTILGLLASSVAILLLTARLANRRQPDSALAALSPEVLFRKAVRRTRALAGSSRARSSAAVHRRRRGARVREVELAAREAAADDDRLAPENIRSSADALFRLIYLAWDARDPARLATLVGPDQLRTWERLLEANERADEHHRAEVRDVTQIDLVGLARTQEGGDTAIVLIEADLAIHVEDRYGNQTSARDESGNAHRLCQYWTLALQDGLWTVHAVEKRGEGERHLSEPIVARR